MNPSGSANRLKSVFNACGTSPWSTPFHPVAEKQEAAFTTLRHATRSLVASHRHFSSIKVSPLIVLETCCMCDVFCRPLLHCPCAGTYRQYCWTRSSLFLLMEWPRKESWLLVTLFINGSVFVKGSVTP